MNKLFSLLVGAVLGSIASAATVLLLTPKSGEAVRTEIKHEVEAIREEGRKASEARRTELEAQLAEMRGDSSMPHAGVSQVSAK